MGGPSDRLFLSGGGRPCGGLFLFQENTMALPVTHRFDERLLQTTAASVASGIAGVARAPCRGQITEVGTMIGSAVATADATCTTSIAGTAITGGSFVITQAASA